VTSSTARSRVEPRALRARSRGKVARLSEEAGCRVHSGTPGSLLPRCSIHAGVCDCRRTKEDPTARRTADGSSTRRSFEAPDSNATSMPKFAALRILRHSGTPPT
jgi:hypothetical protein